MTIAELIHEYVKTSVNTEKALIADQLARAAHGEKKFVPCSGGDICYTFGDRSRLFLNEIDPEYIDYTAR